MRTPPLVSFLTTAYRTEQYLGAAIDSVLAQTSGDWELIVVDNGNSDDIADIVRGYGADPRISLVRQDNKGYRGGVAAAESAATGRFISVLDSDDVLAPTFVERIAEALRIAPGAAAVGCDAELFYEPEAGRAPERYFASIGCRSVPDPRHPVTVEELLRDGIPCYTGAVRRDVWYALGGFDPPEQDVEPDVVLWLRLAAKGADVRILPDRLVGLRQRPLSESRDPQTIDAFEHRLQQSFVTVGHEIGMSTAGIDRTGMLRRLRYQQALRRAREEFMRGRIDEARRFARTALAQQHTVRALAVVAGLQLSPAVLTAIHPLKNRAAERLRQRGHTVANGASRWQG